MEIECEVKLPGAGDALLTAPAGLGARCNAGGALFGGPESALWTATPAADGEPA